LNRSSNLDFDRALAAEMEILRLCDFETHLIATPLSQTFHRTTGKVCGSTFWASISCLIQ